MMAKHVIAALSAIVVLAGCKAAPATTQESAAAPAKTAAAPDPAACPQPQYEYNEDEMGPRGDPLAVPASIVDVAATDNINLAVTTLDGGQICKDMSWAYDLGKSAQTYLDRRFIAIGWSAFEAFGTLMFDRAGTGAVMETGNMPSFSPSNRRVAALQFTQSGMGGLENLVIWDITGDGLKQVHSQPEGGYLDWLQQDYTDFEIASWQGETCLQISAFRDDDLRAVDWDRAKARRTAFHAAAATSWQIMQGGCP